MPKYAASALLFCLLVLPLFASAHAVVKPAQVGVGSFQSFSLGVPVEKEVATTKVRLEMPEGLDYVTPNLKTGWKIEKEMSADGTHVTGIIWSGGSIPAGFREDFAFSAKVPAAETKLAWKAYQTYADGTVVAWDADPAAAQHMNHEGKPDFSVQGPYSVTAVVNDLAATSEKSDSPDSFALAALGLSAVALVFSLRRRSV